MTITDPSELKPAEIFRQASLVSSKTSRGKDKNWYKQPHELEWQLHLLFEGGKEVKTACLHHTKAEQTWRQGPEIPLATWTTGEGAGDLLAAVVSGAFFTTPPKALGIVLHVADEFGLAAIKETAESAALSHESLQILRYNLMDDPLEVLADRDVLAESTSWRLLPFFGNAAGTRGTALALSRTRESFLKQLIVHGEEIHLPLRVAVTAAPIEALAALPLLDEQFETGCLVVLPYLKFTAVFALSQAGELLGARSLLNRGGPLPPNMGDILYSMALGAELVGATKSLKAVIASSNPLVIAAAAVEAEVFAARREPIALRIVDLSTQAALEAIPERRLEFAIYHAKHPEAAGKDAPGVAHTRTFAMLWKDWYVWGNFFDTAQVDRLYPTQRDLGLLRVGSFASLALMIGLLTCGGYGIFSYYQATRHPSWTLTPQQIKLTETSLAKVKDEKRQVEITERLIQPRSRGWTTLEILLRLLPEDSGIQLENFSYGADSVRPTAAAVKGQKAETTGMNRTWSFRGLAKQEALELLNELNSSQGLASRFRKIAEDIQDKSYDMSSGRQLTVALTLGRNPRYKPTTAPTDTIADYAMQFPFTFEISITQAFPDNDALALPVPKPF